MAKRERTKGQQRIKNTTQKTEDRATRTPLKTNVEFMFLLGNHCVCSTYEPQLRQKFSNHIKSLTYIHFLYIEVQNILYV